jgi:hypothetical protein
MFAETSRALLVPLLAFVVLGSFSTGGRPVTAQSRACDPLLEQPPTHPYGYRLRGDRCEGVYVQQVAGTALLIASFTEVFEDYDLRADRDLSIAWSAPAGSQIYLRAHGLRRKLYYRMDAVRPVESRPFRWTADLLASLNITRPDVGVVGWTRLPVGRVERDVYLPLRIGRANSTGGSQTYTLVLLPGVQLSEVFVSLAVVDQDGRPTTFIRDEEALKYNYYPADRPIDIPIPRLASPGLYYMLLGAVLQRGGSTTAELWFYQSPQ